MLQCSRQVISSLPRLLLLLFLILVSSPLSSLLSVSLSDVVGDGMIEEEEEEEEDERANGSIGHRVIQSVVPCSTILHWFEITTDEEDEEEEEEEDDDEEDEEVRAESMGIDCIRLSVRERW